MVRQGADRAGDFLLKSWFATGAPRALASALTVALGIAVSGCAMITAVATPVTGVAPEAVLGTSSAQPGREVPAGVAQTLISAPPGGSLSYQLADGRPASFTLGAVFQSGSGVPCRVGRINPRQVRSGDPTEYPFCRQGDRWFEMTAVVVSSNK
jgi:hypothetical protein